MQERNANAVPVTVADLLAGVLVGEPTDLRFVALDRRFRVLDGSRFRRPDAARRAARRLAAVVLGDGSGERQDKAAPFGKA
ncbi:hypothetical protein [Benzoatithermus flavus]|uniref:Uncharacterized protein n=1 Tax=Benzoatithermus flavus TaxID=3108223 RepID=A0ABU8XWT3_9PROT